MQPKTKTISELPVKLMNYEKRNNTKGERGKSDGGGGGGGLKKRGGLLGREDA